MKPIKAGRKRKLSDKALYDLTKSINKSSHFGLVKHLIKLSRKLGSNSFSYHVYTGSPQESIRPGFNYFTTRRGISRHQRDLEILKSVSLVNNYILHQGKTLSINNKLPKDFMPEMRVLKKVRRLFEATDVVDYASFPVYGPFNVDAVISYSFPFEFGQINKSDLLILEAASRIAHSRLVTQLSGGQKYLDLSIREREVLRWITGGKSKAEIAAIMTLSENTVDTYTRRIFKKLGVYNKVSAAVLAVLNGLVRP